MQHTGKNCKGYLVVVTLKELNKILEVVGITPETFALDNETS